MKKLLILAIALLGIILPWACSDNNAPSKPSGPSLGGSTPSGTVTPGSPTNTPTLAAGAPTFTPTPTFFLPTPSFQHNVQTTGSPTGLVINAVGGGSYLLTSAELQNTSKGTAFGVEGFSAGAGGTLAFSAYSGILLQGFPTPGSTPSWVPVTTGLTGPQGFVNPAGGTGYANILDVQSGGSALLYYGTSFAPSCVGCNGWRDYGLGFFWEPKSISGYGGIQFNNPKGLAADTNGNIYVADTGNGFVEEFTGPAIDYSLVPEHFWSGFSGVTVGGASAYTGTGVTFSSPSLPFKSPYAVTCDPQNYIWVADTGYNPTLITAYTSGATTIIESWPAISGSVAHGLAVDNSAKCREANGTMGPCVYVADAGANVVEVYSTDGILMTEMTNPSPSGYEGSPFQPTCIAFAQISGSNYIFVGDAVNDFIDSFLQP